MTINYTMEFTTEEVVATHWTLVKVALIYADLQSWELWTTGMNSQKAWSIRSRIVWTRM